MKWEHAKIEDMEKLCVELDGKYLDCVLYGNDGLCIYYCSMCVPFSGCGVNVL